MVLGFIIIFETTYDTMRTVKAAKTPGEKKMERVDSMEICGRIGLNT